MKSGNSSIRYWYLDSPEIQISGIATWKSGNLGIRKMPAYNVEVEVFPDLPFFNPEVQVSGII